MIYKQYRRIPMTDVAAVRRFATVHLACMLALTPATAVTMRIYHIGNSLTDQVKYNSFKGLAESRGHTHLWGRQMIPGAPLGWNWDHPYDGFREEPYGTYYPALTGYDWDALVLQPFQWGARTEADYALRFANLALRKNPSTVTYIHMTWPANDAGQGTFEAQWLSDVNAINRSRAYFEFVADSLESVHGPQKVATVDQPGVVTGRAKGRTQALATSVNGGHSDTALVRVTVPNTAPVPVLKTFQTNGYVDALFKFSGTASHDGDSGDYVLGYDWDFGDGSRVNFSMNPAHTYTAAGDYTLRLRVMDSNEERSDWITHRFTVRERAAGLLLYDGFEYPAATAVDGLTTGCGWFDASWGFGNANTRVADTAPPAFGGLNTIGSHLSAGWGGGRQLDIRTDGDYGAYVAAVSGSRNVLGVPDSVLWFSFLVRKERANDAAAYARFHSSIFDCCDPGYLEIGYCGAASNNGGSRYWTVKLDDAVHQGTVAVVPGQTSLLVARMRWTSTGITVDLFVDPQSLGASAPALATVSASADGPYGFRCFALHSDAAGDASFDEVRLGTGFAAVTPTGVTGNPARAAVTTANALVSIAVNNQILLVQAGSPGACITVVDAHGRIAAVVSDAARHNAIRLRAPGMYLVRIRINGTTQTRAILAP